MMVSAMGSSLSLTDAVVHRARTRSERRLAADVSAGALVAAGAIAWRPTGWAVIASAALCFAAFGLWGFSDRLLAAPGHLCNRVVLAFLLVLRTVAVTVGVASALVLLFGIAGLAMGTWIS